jgi:hypothetical protein
MAVLRSSSVTNRYDEASSVVDRARTRSHVRARMRVRCGIALAVYSGSYPLLGAALWRGARDGAWEIASILVAMGVIASFVGWGLLSSIREPRERNATNGSGGRPVDATVYIALYNRVGAIVILLESYTVAATSQGWPMPQTFAGWFALVWIPLLVAFLVPVERSSSRGDARE